MSPTGKLSPRVGELRGPGCTAASAPRRTENRPPEPRLQPEVRKRQRGRCHPIGWEGRKRGKGALGLEAWDRGGGGGGPQAQSPAAQVRGGECHGCPGSSGSRYCCGALRPPATGGTVPADPAASLARTRGRGRGDSHKLQPRPRPRPPRRPPSSRGHCSPRASYLGGSGGFGSGLRAAGCRAGEGEAAAVASEGSPAGGGRAS